MTLPRPFIVPTSGDTLLVAFGHDRAPSVIKLLDPGPAPTEWFRWRDAGLLRVPIWPAYGSATPLLDGTVLAVQGYYRAIVDPRGDPAAFPRRLPNPARPRVMHGAVQTGDGSVLLVGGFDGSTGEPLLRTELFIDGQFHDGPELLEARVGPRVVLLDDGDVLVTGGSGERGDDRGCPGVERLQARSRRFVRASPLTEPRFLHSATVLAGGDVLVAGGVPAKGKCTLRTTERYQARADRWVAGPPLALSREAHSAALVADRGLIVCGGASAVGPGFASEFLPAHADAFQLLENTERWTIVSAVATFRGEVLVAGGGRLERISFSGLGAE